MLRSDIPVTFASLSLHGPAPAIKNIEYEARKIYFELRKKYYDSLPSRGSDRAAEMVYINHSADTTGNQLLGGYVLVIIDRSVASLFGDAGRQAAANDSIIFVRYLTMSHPWSEKKKHKSLPDNAVVRMATVL